MVIDAKLPPQDSSPLSVPPPAYAHLEGTQDQSPHSAPPQVQQYPPPSNQPYPESPTTLPQWQTPGAVPRSIPPDEWVGQNYRNQRKFSSRYSLLSHLIRFSVFARCARGNHDETTSFGLCGIICAILLFPIGLIFLWYVLNVPYLAYESAKCLLASIQRKSAHDVESD